MPTLYLDCDGFFASCEESADPALHGRPVGVSTTDPDNPGAVLIAVNPAAKRRGVGKGERTHEARAAVADLVIRPQRPELYVATHHAIARAVDSVLPGARSRSIDELSAELGPADEPDRILAQVKDAIRAAVGPIITVSCGVAPSSYLAKTAAEANKPDAAVVWRLMDIPDVYEGLELSDLPGLGPATEARLRRRSINSVHALYAADRPVAQWAWGSVLGADVHRHLHGEDPHLRERPRRHISHGRVLEPRLRSWEKGRPIMRFLVMVTLHRCARERVAPARLALEVAGEAGRLWCRGAWMEPTNHEAEALRALSAQWDAIAAKARENPMRFSVVASRLVEWPPRQYEMFKRTGADVQGALDTVRKRFGARAVTLGESADRKGKYTGLKISFEHIPDIVDFEWLGIDVPQIDAGGTA